jgi:hypothetical protein
MTTSWKDNSRKMTRLLIILIPALLIVLAIFAFATKSSKEESKSSFTLVVVEGEVEYKAPGEDNYSSVSGGEIELDSGSFVRTLDNPAEIVFSNENSLSIDANTEMQVEDEDGSTSIKQFFGKTWHRVMNLTGTAQYQVETPTAVAAVRGTKFGVIFTKDVEESQVLVAEDEVEVESITIEDGKKIRGEAKIIRKDELAQIKKEEPKKITVGEIPNEIKSSSWFVRNKKLDEEAGKMKDRGEYFNRLRKIHQESKEYRETQKLPEESTEDFGPDGFPGILGEEFDYSNITYEGLCEEIDISEVRELSAYIQAIDLPNKSSYLNFINLIVKSCSDNVLTQKEFMILREEAEKINTLQ